MIEIDQAVLKRSCDDTNKTLDKINERNMQDAIPVMREAAGDVAYEMAMITMPIPQGGKEFAESRLEAQVRAIFRPIEAVPFGSLVLSENWDAAAAYGFEFESERLQKAYDERDWATVKGAFAATGNTQPMYGVQVVDMPTSNLHHAGRLPNGSWDGNTKYYVSNGGQSKIDSYYSRAKQAIGTMVGGWIYIARMLSKKGANLPSEYASRGSGEYRIIKDISNVGFTIVNHHGNFNNYLEDQKATQAKGGLTKIANQTVEKLTRVWQRNIDTMSR